MFGALVGDGVSSFVGLYVVGIAVHHRTIVNKKTKKQKNKT